MDRFLLFPIAIPLVLLIAGNDAFGFDGPGLIDSFVYVGYFWHYPDHLWVFDDNSNYKISRLPWILPGYVAHTLLGPIGAAYVLAYLTLTLGAVALYLLVRDGLGDRVSAAAVSIAWACCTSMHGVGGWSYHMLAAAGYYLLACWLVVRAARGSRLPLIATLAGVCFAAAVHTHLFLVAFTPLVVMLFWVTWPPARDRFFAHLSSLMAYALAGGAALTLLLALINRGTGGTWLFFMPQIEQAFKLMEPSYEHWWQGNVTAWLPSARYLVVPVSFLLAGLVVPFRLTGDANRRPANGFVGLAWGALAVMCFFQFVRRQTTLDYAYMAAPLYLHAFPCLAAALVTTRRDERVAAPLVGAAAVGVVGSLLLLLPTPLPAVMQQLGASLGVNQWPIVVPLLVSLVGVATMTCLRGRGRIVAFALWFALVNAWIAPSPLAYGLGTAGYHRQMLIMFRDVDRFSSELDPSLIGIKYWLSDEVIASRHGAIQLRHVFDSFLATRAWFTNLLGRMAPSPAIETLSLDDLERGSCIGVLSSVDSQSKLQHAIEKQFERLGRSLQPVAAAKFEGPDLAFALTVLKPVTPTAVSTAAEEYPCLAGTSS